MYFIRIKVFNLPTPNLAFWCGIRLIYSDLVYTHNNLCAKETFEIC